MLDEKKGTCCGRCGHVHVKGTSCPKPFLTGERSCKRRNLEEMSMTSVGVPEFIEYVTNDLDAVEALGFPNLQDLLDYVIDANYQEWSELRQELENYKMSLDETVHFCKQCLIEYLQEYKDKLEEAEYRGRKVSLGKPFLTPGGPKKRAVYVKNAKGNVVKVNFGDPNLKIKKNIPARRKSFRARHKCHTAKDRTTPRYWSCKAW